MGDVYSSLEANFDDLELNLDNFNLVYNCYPEKIPDKFLPLVEFMDKNFINRLEPRMIKNLEGDLFDLMSEIIFSDEQLACLKNKKLKDLIISDYCGEKIRPSKSQAKVLKAFPSVINQMCINSPHLLKYWTAGCVKCKIEDILKYAPLKLCRDVTQTKYDLDVYRNDPSKVIDEYYKFSSTKLHKLNEELDELDKSLNYN